MSATNKPSEVQLISKNRRALHHFAISEHLEAGLVLTGTEVKSCRQGKVQIHEAYVHVVNGQALLMNAHIAEYTQGNRFNHEPTRQRTLLLHQREIDKLSVQLRLKGLSAVPLSLYFKNGRVKLDIGIGKGKKDIDRREDLKERETKRELDREMRR